MERNSTIGETAKHFGVSLSTVIKWTNRGCPFEEGFKGIKKVKKFNNEEVQTWLNSQRKG